MTVTEIDLSDEQRARIAEIARRRHVSTTEVVRSAIDAYVDDAHDEDEDYLEATFGAAPGIGERLPSRDEWDRG